MVPMLKTEKGWLVQLNPVQLDLIRASCQAKKRELSELLLQHQAIQPDVQEDIRTEIKELKGIVDSIDGSLKALASAPPNDFSVEVELLSIQL